VTLKKKFSVVVPVYQNEENLDDTIPKLLSLKKKLLDYNLELVFVDDGSTDDSYEILSRYYELNKDIIRVVKLTKNFGQNDAICAGLRVARGDCVGIISADLQDPYELFVDMIKKWGEGFKLVVGRREGREDSKRTSLISNLYWKMVNKFAVKDYPPGGYDFCVIDRQIVSVVNEINVKNTHIFILIFSLGYNYTAIPYLRRQRSAGRSQWTLSKKLKLFVDTFVSFSYLPIRGISCIGLGISIISFLYGILIVIAKVVFGSSVEGWTTIIVLLSIFGGLILLTLGVIGEYIWRILQEIGKRPSYVIDEILESEQGVSE